MTKVTYKRPSGSLIEIGDTQDNHAEAKRLGWIRLSAEDIAAMAQAEADAKAAAADEALEAAKAAAAQAKADAAALAKKK